MEMITSIIGNETFYELVLLPLLIFIARVVDVSFGTIRVIFVSQGLKNLAAIIAFVEIFVWILAAKQVLSQTNSFILILAYCLGYATGTYIGITISERLSIGKVAVRLFLKRDSRNLLKELRKNNFGITIFNAEGRTRTHSQMIFSILPIKDLPKIVRIIKKHHPKAFYSVETVKKINERPLKRHNNFMRLKLLFGNLYSIKKAK